MEEKNRYDGVWFKVPRKSKRIKKFFSKRDHHWHFGHPLTSGKILNLCFFGISEEQLGGHMVATVTVVEKKKSFGSFTTLHITNTPQAEVLGKIKFIPASSALEGEPLTQDPSTLIYFEAFR